MSDVKFTRGEWVKTGQFTLCIGGAVESYLTTQQTGEHWATVEEREANAHLIKVSPKMYSLLEEISQSNCRADEFYQEIIELLAEARGEG